MVNENGQIVYENGMDPETAAALNAHEYILEVLFVTILKTMPAYSVQEALVMLRNPSGISLPKGSGPVDLEVLNDRREAAFKRLDQFAAKIEKRL